QLRLRHRRGRRQRRSDARCHSLYFGNLSGPQVRVALPPGEPSRGARCLASAEQAAVVRMTVVAIVGAGPYGLSLAAHLAARNIKHRVFGCPMLFWSQIAQAGGERYLKSFCFGTSLSTPTLGYSFADYSEPRGLETFEPCSIGDFAAYGRWFQKNNVPWTEPIDVVHLTGRSRDFLVTLADGQCLRADSIIIATGLAGFAEVPPAVASLP